MNINQHNKEYSGGIPDAAGDRYYSQDIFRDFHYLLEKSGLSISDIIGSVPFLVSGGYATKGTGWDDLNITVAIGYHEYDVTSPDSFVSIPPTTKTDTLRAQRVESTAQTDFDISGATLDGATVNYLKLEYSTTNGNSRSRAKKSGSYNYELVDSFTITADATPGTSKQVTLATFVGDGSSFLTITNIEPLNLKKLYLDNLFQDDSRYCIEDLSGVLHIPLDSPNLSNSDGTFPTLINSVRFLDYEDSNAKFPSTGFYHIDNGFIVYAYTFGDDICIKLRIKPNWDYNTATSVTAIDLRGATGSGTENRILLAYEQSVDKFTFYVDDDSSNHIRILSDAYTSNVDLQDWIDLILTISKTGNDADMYINGVQQGGGVEGTKTTTGTGITNIVISTSEISIGSANHLGMSYSTKMDAYITGMIIKDSFDTDTTNYDGTTNVYPYYNENQIALFRRNGLIKNNGDAGFKTISSNSCNFGGGYLKEFVAPIGGWDMDASPQSIVSVPSDLILKEQIVSIYVSIYPDSGASQYAITHQGGGYVNFSNSGPSIISARVTGQFFDSTGFNDTTINRGIIYVKYRV